MAQSSEAETSGGVSSEIDYEVFLSFRGPDTRQGFTDCLYNHLQEANIRVFLDEEKLHVGKEIADELPAAIKNSKIYIPIFSKGYASSAWCLRELAHMVECRESKPSEKDIMPIFYDVETDVVKLKSQLYVDALDQHVEKFGHNRRQEWENALKSVAKIKGWELKEQGYWKVIKSVTKEILMKLKTKDKLVTEHLVGADITVKDVEKLLDVDSEGMRVVLIHGMGGIGKTTLAKIIFNRMNSHFSHCCFLQDVRETSLKSYEILQERLLSNMFGSSFCKNFNDVDGGITEIKHLLSGKKVLIVLDDVSDEEQLDKLAIKHISFGSGSRLIMTTRDRSLVVLPDQTSKYEVKPLDSVQSFELFSRHAFKSNLPPDDYVSLSEQVVSTTGGLPLALEVIGSLLHPRKKDLWIDVLQSLRKVPDKQVEEKLKISYNALSYEQKQIFLDIACLFLNEDLTNAFYMWEDCEYRPRYSIDVLVCMSLIKIIDDNKLWMHDQLRDLGRKIVRGEPMHPRKQSRLWDAEMAERIIRTKEEKEAIEAICLRGSEVEEYASKTYTSGEFSRLPQLRFLMLPWGDQLSGDFEHQFSALRYMSWWGCPEELSATNFHPSNLVVLELCDSGINEDWAGWSQIKVVKKLKVLNLTYCTKMTRTPDFSDYMSLERLILQGCSSLIEVDASFEKLKCLVHFDVDGCSSLEELPEEIGRLTKQKYLSLVGCKKLRKLPESLGSMASLVELDLSYMAITKIPNSIGNLKHLLVLKLKETNIDELPNSIGKLQKLESLDLSHKKIREFPESIGEMESLLELDVSFTQCLQLPESIGELSRLKVINIAYSPIRNLPPSIVELKDLEELRAENCKHLKWEIPKGIWKLSHLRVLRLDNTPITNVPVTFKQLPRLENLGLDGCNNLEQLPELPTSLISLSFGSSSLRLFPNLSSQTLLKTLTYNGHDEKRCPLFFQDGPCRESHGFLPPSMSKLDIRNNKMSASFSLDSNFRNLIELWIINCSWKEVQLDGLEQLAELCVINLELLEGLAGLSGLKRLKRLTLLCCPNLTTIQGLGSVESLITLEIEGCCKIESLEVSGLKKLEYLFIKGCEELVTVEGLGELESLKILELYSCTWLTSVPNAIKSKVLDECRLFLLEELTLSCCSKIESLEVSGFKRLEQLCIEECEELVTVEGLDELESLKSVYIASCGSLKTFPNAINSKIPDACHLCVNCCPNFEGNCGDAFFNASFGEYRSRYS